MTADQHAQYRLNPRRVEFVVDAEEPRRCRISVAALELLAGRALTGGEAPVMAYRQHWELIHQLAQAHSAFSDGEVFLLSRDMEPP